MNQSPPYMMFILKLINDEAFIYQKEEKKLAYVTAAFLKLIDNNIVLNQVMEGENSSKFEGPVEVLLRIIASMFKISKASFYFSRLF